MRPTKSVRIILRALAGLLLVLGTVFVAAPGAQAATTVSDVAEALKKSPVYVDPEMRGEVPDSERAALVKDIKDSGKAIFLAVLPADFPKQDLFGKLRTETGITGVYGVRVGDQFDARADTSVLSEAARKNIVGTVQGLDAPAQLTKFTSLAASNAAGGTAGDDGVSSGALIGLGAVALAGGAGAYALVRRNKRKKAEAERAALDKLRVVVDEDITAFGEELDRLDFHPGEPGATDEMRTDYERGLDSYEKAKSIMASAERPDDVRGVTQALEDGRFSLAVLAARREGRPLPERRAPCFFDPRHGPSVADASWAPVGATPREVPVCAADKARIDDGEDPAVRTVDTEHGRRPYYDAGPAYGPWAGGYFGGGILPGLLMGTMLGSMMSSPAYAADGGMGGGGYEGGDQSGADFDSGDFGGGFGGGDFGGGGGDFGGGF
ncbi:hypothetical protein ACFQVC_41625 [Streptomyces monticola]|uniref:TPM domain-containing protein n=1 Tax=Streptomyces monticola TaxID=2666263 RepID=A0ABW2JYS1_9ACTN